MSSHPSPLPQQQREHPEPSESRNPVPLPVIVLVSVLVGWAGGYLSAANPDAAPELGDQRTPSALAGTAAAPAGAQLDGAAIYAANCVSCHQSDGHGLPQVFPPLAGSEWVQGDEATLVQIILHGINGSIEVAGQQYAGMMPPMGSVLDDAQIAAVASHVRSSWGNDAAAVEAATVAAERERTSDRTAPWNDGDELKSLAQ